MIVFALLGHSQYYETIFAHFFCFLDAFTSWASGALDPESSASGDLVTSVKRYVIICYIW